MMSGAGAYGRFAAVAIAAWSLVAPSSLARQDAGGGDAKPAFQTLLLMERGTCDDLFVSSKDAELRQALGMLPIRLRELREQVPELRELPPEMLELMIGIVGHPVRMSITDRGFDPQTGMPGLGMVVSFKMGDRGEAEAWEMHERIEMARGLSRMPFEPGPSRRFNGMNDLPLPMGVLSYGPRKAADGWRYEMIFAAVDDPDAAFAGLPAMEAGVQPVLRGSIDLAAWSPLVSMFAGFAAMASPQGVKAVDQFREMGLLGPDALKMDWSLGHAADSMRGMFAVRRIGKHAGTLAISRSTVTPEDLQVIPADASFAGVKKIDIAKQWANMRRQFESMGAAEFRQGYEQVKSMLGFDPETEIIAALGDTAATYFADSTGGGSLLSGVALLSLSDPAKINSAMDRLASRANALMREQAKGPFTVEVARFEREGITYTQLRTPGFPAFLEPTIAVTGRWMIIGTTAQAATAAAKHIRDAKPGAGLASKNAFASAQWELPGGAKPMSVFWVDSSRTMRDGYASLALYSSMVANLARTAGDAKQPRDPGLVLPVYADLIEGARPMLMMAYWSGDDLVAELRGDRSTLVTLATLIGVGDAAPFMGGMLLGAGMGSQAAEKAHSREGLSPNSSGYTDDGHDSHNESPRRETPY